MYRLLGCLRDQHSPSLVAIAAAICLSSCYVTLLLFDRSKGSARRGPQWLAAAVFTSGTGIWSTHFVAMLAYDPGVMVSYRIDWTLGSLVIAILFSWPALVLAWRATSVPRILGAGAALGLAIAATHNLGMLGVQIPGRFVWDVQTALASDAVGMLFAMAAFAALARDTLGHGRSIATAGLFVAICALHFVGMSSVLAVPDPRVAMPLPGFPREALALSIASLVALVLTLGLSAVIVSVRVKAAAAEATRFQHFADAALEGLASLRDGVIADANRSLVALLGVLPHDLVGRPFHAFLDGGASLPVPATDGVSLGPIRADLRRGDGSLVSVELFLRVVPFTSGPRTVISVLDVRERDAAEARIFFLAHHDSLTGLHNRASLDERLSPTGQLQARRPSLALHCIDLDRFKHVNDSLGHAAGDEILRQVAGRLRSTVRAKDELFRLGGDEFVVIQADVEHGRGEAESLAARLVAELGKPYRIGEHVLDVGASVGVALHPLDASELPRVLSFADAALYAAKGRRRGTYHLFDATLDAASRDRLDLESRLRKAIGNDELRLVFQPQISLRTGSALGYEALLRWRNPVLGDVPPSRFIGVAEEIGIVCDLGAWALEAACAAAATWERPLKISVNLSAAQFQHGDLVGLVQRVLGRTGLCASRLELEITETVLIRDAQKARTDLQRLRDLGVNLALDDFGQGYSSLGYLHRFPFDTVKIDRSFVADLGTDPASLSIVRAVVELGRALGLRVIAEGVERPGQLEQLRKLNCTAAQGYLLGYPREAADIGGMPVDHCFEPLSGRLRLIA